MPKKVEENLAVKDCRVLVRIRSWYQGIELERVGYRSCVREEEDVVSAEVEKNTGRGGRGERVFFKPLVENKVETLSVGRVCVVVCERGEENLKKAREP